MADTASRIIRPADTATAAGAAVVDLAAEFLVESSAEWPADISRIKFRIATTTPTALHLRRRPGARRANRTLTRSPPAAPAAISATRPASAAAVETAVVAV